jgi:ATP-dependent RNA helicase DDX27
LDPDHPDFDSEEEYGRESGSDSEDEEGVFYDDGKNDEELVSDDDQVEEEESGDSEEDQEEEPKFEVKQAPVNQYLIKREATLIALLQKTYQSRVIIFSNEKLQCTRLMALLAIFGFKAGEVHGNMAQSERLASVEQFQRGDFDFLIATDVIARGLDIPNVKAVINFSFPNEPKRYLHRIGRTARAGQHGVSITLCNEEERKDLKKISRKLNQNVHTFSLQGKYVEPIYKVIHEKLDKVMKEVMCELEQDREMKETMREIQRSENLIKHRQEIISRPRKEWIMGKKRTETIKKESRADLQQIKHKFESSLKDQHEKDRKRTQKQNKK